MDVGSLTITPLYDAEILADPHRMYSLNFDQDLGLPGSHGLTAEDWRQYDRFLADGQIEMTFGGFLVSGIGSRVVLIDLGMGPSSWVPQEEFTPRDHGRLIESLARAGHQPADVTDIVLTHLHFDHIGWASVDGQVTFPNATVHCHAADLEHFYPRDEHVAQLLAPVESRLQTWSSDCTLLPGFDIRPVPGHTPGSSLVVISSGGARAMLLGDVLHCPMDLLDAEWSGLADVDPGLARSVRVALAREIEGSGVPVAAAHFPGLRFGRLLRRDEDQMLDFSYLG